MRAAKKPAVDSKLLQELVPLNALSPERFRELSEKIVIEEVLAGSYLFRKGDRDNQSIYLLEGKINLIDGFRKVISEVEAGTEISRYPIANQQPRSLSARAVKKAVIAKVDSSLLDIFLTWDQSSSPEAVEIGAETNNDWMTRILQSEAFIKIPPSMIQSLLMKMEALPVKAGDVVIHQGDSGDYFYTIHEGRCAVTQKTSPDGVEELLAELSDGDSFGEDSLVTDTKRNATVSMLTDGLLMRLAKKDFVELLKNQLVRHVGYEEAAAMVAEGAVWVDVRTPEEYENGAFEDSVNIPLLRLRHELSELVFNSKYIICCDTGRRSESAGFLLSHKGFDVYVLEGGIPGLSSEAVESALQENGADSVDDPAEVITFDGSMRAPVRQTDAESYDVKDGGLESDAADGGLVIAAADESETSLDEMRTENQALKAQLEASHESERRLGEQLEQLRGELGESGEKLGSLYAQAEVDAEQLENLRGELGEAGEKLAAIYAKENESAEEKQLLQNQYQSLQEEFSSKTSSFEQEVGQLREQLAEMQSQAGSVNNEHQLLLAETAANDEVWKAAKKEYEERLQQQTDQSDAYKVELERIKEEFAALMAHFNEKSGHAVDLETRNSALSDQVELLQADLQEGREQLAAIEAAAQQRQQDSDEQIKSLREALEQQQQQFSETTDRQAAVDESIRVLEEENERLRTEVSDASLLLEEKNEQLVTLQDDRKVLEESSQRQQQEWDAERSAFQQTLDREQQVVAGLREDLSRAELQSSEEKSALEVELKAQLENSNKKIEQLETNLVAFEQERSSEADELQSLRSERAQLQQRYEDIEEQNRQLQDEVGLLRQQAESQVCASEEQQQQLLTQLEKAQATKSSLERSAEEKDVQINSLLEQLAQRAAEYEEFQLQHELLQQQQGELRLQLEQQEARARMLEEENKETVRKAHEDLTRKNDNEKELQGQIDRLRKKLEQQTADQQKAREVAQDDIEHIRDQLHAERQARSEERSEMAARQRELKEQLALVAIEHEANLSNHTGAIEQARHAARQEEQERLRELLAIHVETEDQVVKLQQELKKAHEEIAELARHEKDRRRIDIDLMEEQNQQAVATIVQLESQLKQSTEERDAALQEQQSLRNKLDALRGEVEVVHGLMGAGEQVEDPAQLHKELNESKKNMEIALRLRIEAEAARDRALQERNALQQQLESGASTCVPLHVPSLDEDEAGSGHPGPMQQSQQEKLPVTPLEREPDKESSSLLDRVQEARQRRWPVAATGLGAVVVCALAGWLLLDVELPRRENNPLQQLPATTIVDAEPILADTSELPKDTVPPTATPVEEEIEEEAAVLKLATADTAAAVTKAPAPKENQANPVPEEVAPVTQQRPPVIAGRAFRDNLQVGGQGPVMVELPAGSFEMGSIGNSLNFDEGPRHEVKMAAFSMSKFEITFAEYDRFARTTGRRLPYDESWGRADRPVINISWQDARAYSLWLSEQTGKQYRLPSEAEWEYATRAGSTSNFWWSDDSNNLHANCFNCGSEWDGTRTAPVGSFNANDFGLHDVSGNVQEWTADCYHGSYQGAPDDGSAWLFPECAMRVVRGGAYTSPMDSLRSAKRSQYNQDTRLDNLGFRVVREN